jgi:hypothetical protein
VFDVIPDFATRGSVNVQSRESRQEIGEKLPRNITCTTRPEGNGVCGAQQNVKALRGFDVGFYPTTKWAALGCQLRTAVEQVHVRADCVARTSGLIGLFTGPHQTSFSEVSSCTIRLSDGDLPVFAPEYADRAPLDVIAEPVS